MRKSDMSLYKSYQQNEQFREDFRAVIIKMLSDSLDCIEIQKTKDNHITERHHDSNKNTSYIDFIPQDGVLGKIAESELSSELQ